MTEPAAWDPITIREVQIPEPEPATWTEITIHRREQALTVRVQADSPAAAAAALDPFVAPDTILAGPYTTREQAVEAILQERRIAAATDLERAQHVHQQALADLQRLHTETAPEEQP